MFFFFKIIGYRASSNFGYFLGKNIGPFFRSKSSIVKNLKKAEINEELDYKKIASNILGNYGRIFAEYVHLKNFKNNKLNKYISIDGLEHLQNIKKRKQKVVFVSGHFNNFELMAMQIEKMGIKVAAIYRPLNNIFLNYIMVKIRKKYICKYQIKKGIGGLKDLLKLSNQGFSTALMIDQRVTEGIKSKFFNENAFTTTIPAQLVKKFKLPVVPIFIDRFDGTKFKISIQEPINFSHENSVKDITDKLNNILEKMIIKNPNYWIWSHNRWK